MREQLKALSKETLIYGTSTIVGRFLNFILVPFYVNVLSSTAEYGISTSLYVYLGFLNMIYPLGLEAAYFRYASKGEQETRSEAEERRLFSSPFLLILAIGAVLSTIFILLAPTLASLIFSDGKTDLTRLMPSLERMVVYAALILLLDALAVLPFAALRLEHQAKRFAFIRLFNIVLTLVLNFLLIVGWGWGVEGIFAANLIASASVLLLLLPTILKRLEFRVHRDVLRTFVPFGLTNVPAYLGSMVVQVIGRPFVQAFLGLSILGVFQANYRMGFAMMILVGLFEYAWRPFFLRQAKTDDERARKIFAKVFTYFMLFALVAFLMFSFFMPYIVSTPIFGRTLLTPEYRVGLYIIPIVLAAYIFQGMYTNFLAGIYIKERNKVLPLITGAGAIVSVITNATLIPLLGISGAALASLFAYLTMAVYIYRESQKVYPIAYEWGKVALLAVIVLTAFGIDLAVSLSGWLSYWQQFAFRSGMVVLVAVVILLSGFFSSAEKRVLRELVQRMSGRRAVEHAAVPEPVQSAEERSKIS